MRIFSKILLFVTLSISSILLPSLTSKQNEEMVIVTANADYFMGKDGLTVYFDDFSFKVPSVHMYFVGGTKDCSGYYVADTLENEYTDVVLASFMISYNDKKDAYTDLNIQIFDSRLYTYYNLAVSLEVDDSIKLTQCAFEYEDLKSETIISRIKTSLSYYGRLQVEAIKGNTKLSKMAMELIEYTAGHNDNNDYINRDASTGNYKYNTYPTNYDSYTNTNNIIIDYEDDYFGNFLLPNNDITDDPIVNIVPKELFFTVGQYLYIGREYGFFVNTTIDYINSNDYCSDVFVFDIIFEKHNMAMTNGTGSLKIAPTFEYRYRAVDKERRNNIWDGYDSSLTRVVYPHLNYNAPDYYISDVSIKHSLENETALNIDDDNYNGSLDYGSFFIQSRLNLSGVGLKRYNNYFLRDVISYAFGLVHLDAAAQFVEFLIDLYSTGTYVEEHISDNEENINSYATNRYYQLQLYGDLLRKLNITTKEESNKKQIYGINGYVESKYVVSCYEDEITSRVINSISLSVGVDNTYFYLYEWLSGGYYSVYATESSYYSTSKAESVEINEMYTGQTEFLSDSTFYRFIPEYTGSYVCETSGNADTFISLYTLNDVLLSSNDNGGVGQNARISYNLTRNNVYFMKVANGGNTTTNDYSFSVKYNIYSPIVLNMLHPAPIFIDNSYEFKLCKFAPSVSGYYIFETSGTNVDPYLYLFDADFNLLAYNDDSGYQLNAKIIYYLNSSYDYYLIAKCSGSGTGDFSLGVNVN